MRSCFGLACFVFAAGLGLWFAFPGVAQTPASSPENNVAIKESPAAADTAPCASCGKKDDEPSVCPFYVYFDHGNGTCSFYAILCPETTPTSYTADCKTTLSSGENCPYANCILRLTGKPEVKAKHGHGVSDVLAKGKKEYFTKFSINTEKADPIIGTERYVKFTRNMIAGGGAKSAFARIIAVRIKKTGEIFGIGNEVEKVPSGETATELHKDQVVANGVGCNILVLGSLSYQVVAVDK